MRRNLLDTRSRAKRPRTGALEEGRCHAGRGVFAVRATTLYDRMRSRSSSGNDARVVGCIAGVCMDMCMFTSAGGGGKASLKYVARKV